MIIKKIIEGIELYLTIQFQDFTDVLYIKRKVEVLIIFQIYLKVIDYSGYTRFSHIVFGGLCSLVPERVDCKLA